MASRDIFTETEGQYRGARVLYSPYIPRSHGTYNIANSNIKEEQDNGHE